MAGRGGDVTAAQRDQTEDAARGRDVSVRPERLGRGQGGQARRLGVGQPAGGQVDARTQDGQPRLGRDTVQRLAVGGVQDFLRFVETAQVGQRGGERQQRPDIAGIRRDPGDARRAQ